MRLSQLLDLQPTDTIQWSEPVTGTLAFRYPMLDMEIQPGAKLAVREGEMALFVDQGRIADVFGTGIHALTAANLPLLGAIKNWGREFEPPFKTDVYFLSMHDEIMQKWGTATPLSAVDLRSGAMHVRGYGSYSYRITDACAFFNRVCGTRESYSIYDLDDRLRPIIVARLEDFVGASGLSELELALNPAELSEAVMKWIKPVFATLGLELMQFAIHSISLRDAFHRPPALCMELASDGKRKTADEAIRCDSCCASMRADHDVLKCDYCHSVVVRHAGDDGVGGRSEYESHTCPSCEIPLMQAMIGGATLLYCTRCDGMLVAMDEFESLVAAARALPGGAAVVAAAESPDAVDCPECGRVMGMSFYAGDVAIDSCEDCGLNWLDHRQLARIVHGPVKEFRLATDGDVDASESGPYFKTAHTGSPAEFNLGA